MVTAEVPGQTAPGYDGMLSQLSVVVRQAPGFVLHTSHAIEGGWRVIEIWESQHDANEFFAHHVHPHLPPGIKPKRSFQELYSLLSVEGPIEVDMSSLGGDAPVQLTGDQLIAGFQAGLHSGKVSHHLATNYRITVDDDRAELWAHGYAWNRVPRLPAGTDLWETWGNYRLSFRQIAGQWRLDGFRYYSKLTRGNDAVRTHTQ